MILVDTAVWIDHFRERSSRLADALERGQVLGHPWVTGELALGRLRNRAEILRLLGQLPQATLATTTELLDFIDRHELYGTGLGYVDAQLLAATRLTDDALLWTHDRRLHAAAERLGAAHTSDVGD